MDQQSPTLIVAIDPGESGGLAYRNEEGIVTAVAMPETDGDVLDLLRDLRFKLNAQTAWIEDVGGYIGKPQPGSAMWKFGYGVGFLNGALMALGFRVERVRPQRWQRDLGIGNSTTCASKTEWKNKLKALSQRRFPGVKVTLAVADALLILDYAENLR